MYNLGQWSPVCCGCLYTTGTERWVACTVTHMQILVYAHRVIMSGCTPSACCLACELSDTTHSLVFVLHKLICFSHFWHTHACAWHSSAPLVCLMLHCAVVMRLGTHRADVILKTKERGTEHGCSGGMVGWKIRDSAEIWPADWWLPAVNTQILRYVAFILSCNHVQKKLCMFFFFKCGFIPHTSASVFHSPFPSSLLLYLHLYIM